MMKLPIGFLFPDARPHFPEPSKAMITPNGLLAAGGALTPEWLIEAYRHGIFPWFGKNEPILWWSPDPRFVFDTDRFHVSHSLRKHLRRCGWTIHADQAFDEVIAACAAPRPQSPGTWLTPAMIAAYRELHRLGHAHSIEVRDGERLVGGVYGIATGHVFCGESMFSAASGGSKVALLALCRKLASWGWPLLDAQVPNDHLMSLGGHFLPRSRFLEILADGPPPMSAPRSWRDTWPAIQAADLA